MNHEIREEVTKLILAYAKEYTNYKIASSQADGIKPPLNPVIDILNIFNQREMQLQNQINYWKLSFNKQCEANRKD